MITGEIKNQIDQIWDTFFVAGITNPITVLEQMTYIFFMKMLDDKQIQEEDNACDWEGEVKNPTFLMNQNWLNPETHQEVPYESMRWHVFRTQVRTTCLIWFALNTLHNTFINTRLQQIFCRYRSIFNSIMEKAHTNLQCSISHPTYLERMKYYRKSDFVYLTSMCLDGNMQT